MSRIVRQWRWRLARWFAPEPVMVDPCPGRESFVVHRSKPGEGTQYQVSIALDELDISVTSEPDNLFGRDPETTYFNNWHRRVTVTGSAES